MPVEITDYVSYQKVDAAALFRKLGLEPTDEEPILRGWRQANDRWRRERLERVQAHTQRVQAHLRRFRTTALSSTTALRAATNRPRAVWCVELRRSFRSISEAAQFVERTPSNVSQSLKKGVRCGTYHWEEYDKQKHG